MHYEDLNAIKIVLSSLTRHRESCFVDTYACAFPGTGTCTWLKKANHKKIVWRRERIFLKSKRREKNVSLPRCFNVIVVVDVDDDPCC
jgi:hypothetical protein